MKVIYVAGPFRGADAWEIARNVHLAERGTREIARLGAMPCTPHSIGAHMNGTETAEFWVEGTLELMRRCDAVLVLPGHGKSTGTRGEIAEARRLRIPYFGGGKIVGVAELRELIGISTNLLRDDEIEMLISESDFKLALQELGRWLRANALDADQKTCPDCQIAAYDPPMGRTRCPRCRKVLE